MSGDFEIILKLLIGTLLGGIIGFERQTHGRPAGFRTQLLVCVACVLLMIISENYYVRNSGATEFIRLDPTRIAAGAMTGIGFLGAGVILKAGASVQGLTTAACIWIVAAIGIAVGAGQYLAAVTGFVITFVSLWLLRILEVRMPRTVYKYITLITDETGDEQTLRAYFEAHGFKITKMDYEITFPEKERTYMFTIAGKHSSPIRRVIDTLSGQACVRKLVIKS